MIHVLAVTVVCAGGMMLIAALLSCDYALCAVLVGGLAGVWWAFRKDGRNRV
jgi:putative intracellular protease/amidase